MQFWEEQLCAWGSTSDDTRQGRDTPAAGEQMKKSKKELAIERNPYAQIHHPAVPHHRTWKGLGVRAGRNKGI